MFGADCRSVYPLFNRYVYCVRCRRLLAAGLLTLVSGIHACMCGGATLAALVEPIFTLLQAARLR